MYVYNIEYRLGGNMCKMHKEIIKKENRFLDIVVVMCDMVRKLKVMYLTFKEENSFVHCLACLQRLGSLLGIW